MYAIRSYYGGKKKNEKKNSNTMPAEAIQANSLMGGISLTLRDKNPIAVVRVVRKRNNFV